MSIFFLSVLRSSTIRYDTRKSCLCNDYSPWLGQRMASGDICICTSPDVLKYIGSFYMLLSATIECQRNVNLQFMTSCYSTLYT